MESRSRESTVSRSPQNLPSFSQKVRMLGLDKVSGPDKIVTRAKLARMNPRIARFGQINREDGEPTTTIEFEKFN